MNTTTNEATGTTAQDAYEMGRYVTRHYGKPGAWDRLNLAMTWASDDPLFIAYHAGREHERLALKK